MTRQRTFCMPLPVIALVALLTCFGCRTQQNNGLTGQIAPECSLTMLDGSTVHLNDLRGKPVLLEFWAPWCTGCLQNIPPLKQLHQRFNGQIAMIATSSEAGVKTVSNFVGKHAIPYPVAISNRKLLEAYRISVIPVTMLIDAQGVIRYHHAGQFQLSHLEERITHMLEQTLHQK